MKYKILILSNKDNEEIIEDIYLKEMASEAVGSRLVNMKSGRQACRLEPQAGADPPVLRQNFFLLQEASGFSLQAFD